jgi:hypothetical protein
MSPKNSLLNVGLTALGLYGLAASSVADPGLPAPPGQSPAAAATAAPSSASSSAPAATMLSLVDGRVLPGKIRADASGYSVIQNGGELRFRKELVEGAFGSLQEVYRFKADRVPDRDPDERLKLALWCLTHHLDAEAKAQLLAVLDLSPDNAQIKSMVAKIDYGLTRATVRDEGIVRTRAERPGDGRPAEIDEDALRPARKAPAAVGLPVIFDLPTPLAVKRADEFNRNVHQVLQRHCARCHNENYPGEFQLIQVKTRQDWTPNVARANLEAALRMIDPEGAARSELLTRGLVPHGPGRRPIFRGATDPDYQRVAAWVNSLRPRPTSDPATATRFGTPDPAPIAGEGFATDRARPSDLPLPPDAPTDGRPPPPATPNPRTPLPPGQFVAGSGTGTQPYAPPDAKFPAPYMVGGPRPKLDAASAPQGQPVGTLPPLPASAASAMANVSAATANVSAAAAAVTAKVPAAAGTDAGAGADAPPKPPGKQIKFDPALLERALMNRYAAPAPQ